jgi:TolB-like protein
LAWKITTYLSIIIIVVLVSFQIFSRGANTTEILESEKSIAVLPFKNMSDGSEFAHLGDAMTDEIIRQLYKINAFEVRSRTSSIMQYKDTEKGSPLIGKELNVNYLLEGSTQRY